ncbi:MAG: DUF1236 domain-containing protein [Pseudorhodoplanes sp.]
MNRIFTAAIFSFALLGAAQAQTVGTATTDLNLRTGPGPEQPVIGFIKTRQKANIIGCVEGSLWCQVSFRGKTGWAYSQYMSLQAGGGRIVVREPANLVDVPVTSYDALGYRAPTYGPDVAPIAAAITDTVVGNGGPGAGAIGAPRPAVYVRPYGVTPPPAIGQYVASNTTNSFYYSGDVAVGASIPQTVVLNNVPDYRYQYVYVNDTPVLVDPVTRQIVYVFRQ